MCVQMYNRKKIFSEVCYLEEYILIYVDMFGHKFYYELHTEM